MDAERSSGCQGLQSDPKRLEVLSADGRLLSYSPRQEKADMSGFDRFDLLDPSLKEGVPA